MLAIAYRSIAIHPFSEDEVTLLADTAAMKNERLDVTGYLYFRDSQFIQYIEGPEDQLRALFNRIAGDPRHTVTHQIELPDRTQRIFPHWYMRFVDHESANRATPAIEDELTFILTTASEKDLSPEEFASALDTITTRIATLDLA
ncbi:MAG: BLUF domain-containing protein [Verrucomicrobiota bacterium]